MPEEEYSSLPAVLSDLTIRINEVQERTRIFKERLLILSSTLLKQQEKQDKETKINQAMEEYNKVVPEAIGSAEQTIKNAQGYAISVVNEAQGDSVNFMEKWSEYRKAPTITKERMYLETMERTLPDAGEVIIIDDKGLNGGLLNILGPKGGLK